MLKTKKRSLIAFLLCAIVFNNTYTMDQPEEGSTLGWAAVIGGVLLGAVAMKYLWQQPGEPFSFTELPQDMQNKIIELASIYSTTESLEIAAKTINSLAQVNKDLNQKINDPLFCLQLIKHLSKKFDVSNEDVAKALQTQEAKRRLALQNDLFLVCHFASNNELKALDDLYQQGIDFDFTYNTPGSIPQETALMFLFLPLETTLLEKQQKAALNIMHYLFVKNIDINATNHAGQTALIIACQGLRERWAVKELIKAPNIDLNHKDMFGKTALMYLAEKSAPSPNKRSLQLLIEAGADPELGNDSGLTPLSILQNRPDQGNPQIQEAINYLKDAIVKKYAPKK